MRKTIYTLWKGMKDEPDEALLLSSEKLYLTKHGAFKRARTLAKQLIAGWDYVILVRKITLGSNACKEWEFYQYDTTK